jgi:hypothetical protein
MKRIAKIISTAVLLSALAGCSSSSASASSTASAKASEHTYSETADVTSLTFEETAFHGVSLSMPKEWSGRKSSSADEIDYSVKGTKDAVQFIYTDNATASEDMFKTLNTSMTWTPSTTEEKDINGIKAFHAAGTSTIFNVIQMDAATDAYLIQDGQGVTAILFIQDPEGTVDQSPVFEKILSSIKMK